MSLEKIDLKNNERPDEPHKILIYGYKEEERIGLRDFFKKINKDVFFVEKYLLHEKVCDLISKDSFHAMDKSLNENFPDVKFMLLSGFSNKELNDLFSLFKSENVKRPVAATLTVHNKEWLFKDLIKDVYEEHQMMMNQLREKQQK